MTTPNTELAAQARRLAEECATGNPLEGDAKAAASLLRQLADALESKAEPAGLSGEDITEGAERHGITVAGPRLDDFQAGVRWAELVIGNPPDAAPRAAREAAKKGSPT